MAKICQAGILREFKSTKAESVRKDPVRWPKYNDLPDCGGTITFSVFPQGGCTCQPDDDYCYCPSLEVHVNATCSRCKAAFYPGIDALTGTDARYYLEKLLNEEISHGEP